MSGGLEKELLRLASAESLERIRLDRVQVTGFLRRFLDYLEPNLFEPDLNVAQWKRATGVHTSSLDGQFRKVLGCSPSKYVAQARMETASRLLSRTDLAIGRIGFLVGMPVLSVFSRAFERWTRLRPSQYRQRYQQAAVASPRSEVVHFCRLGTKLLAGSANLEESTELADHLVGLYPGLRLVSSLSDPDPVASEAASLELNREAVERWRAERIWAALQGRSIEYQRDIVRSQVGLETTALFDMLRWKSREEGRKDRSQGVILADLALASLEVCGREEDLNFQVWGRVWLANARRLALDYPGAEREFAVAETQWAYLKEARDHGVEAELTYYKANLRWYQRRIQEALKLVDEAVVLNRQLNNSVEIARSLLLRALIRQYNGDVELALADVNEALLLLEGTDQHYLRVSAYSSLAESHVALGNYSAAKYAADRAQVFSQRIEFPLGKYQVAWLAGRVEGSQGELACAEKHYRRALEGMISLGEHDYAALISLDLAIIYAQEGKVEKVSVLVMAVISNLEIFKVHHEVLGALKILQRVAGQRAIDINMLKMVRELVGDILTSPSCLPDLKRLKGERKGRG